MEQLIRQAKASDAVAIARVHVETWRSTYRGIVAQDHIDSLTVDDFAARWQTRLADPNNPPSTVLVATDSTGDIVGFTSGGATRDSSVPFDAELYAIYLLQECQGAGLGRQLVSRLVAHLIQQNLASLCVSVLTDNPARHFYERLGASCIRNEPHIIGGRAYQASWFGWHDLRVFSEISPTGVYAE